MSSSRGQRPGQTRLTITPVSFVEAKAFCARHHRTHPESEGWKFGVAVASPDGVVRGIGMAGRPVARRLWDGFTVEALRVATDGWPNACSALYAALWRAARALGYLRLVTYSLPDEGGTSLRAAGYRLIGEAGGGTWDRPLCGRPRVDLAPTQTKLRWECP